MSIVATTLSQKLFGQPMVAPDSFKGQRALITGGTAGLGLATAIHLAQLGASSIAITCRDAARGEAAKKQIEAASSSNAVVKVLELDMAKYSSTVAFVDKVKSEFGAEGGLDWICLNAGTHFASSEQSAHGWEMDIQVNVLSTVLLAELLLPWMRELRSQRQKPAHLTFVTSGLHTSPDISKWDKFAEQGGILKHFSVKENWPGTSAQYSLSKLMMQYASKEIEKQVLDGQGRPDVIINTCCPGMVSTELARGLKDISLIIRLGAPVVMSLIAQKPDVGSRMYLAAGLTTEAEHGKFIKRYVPVNQYEKESARVLKGEVAEKVQKLVWAEIKEELASKVPQALAAK